MPLIAHNGLPAYARLSTEGHVLIGSDRARHQDIRELHVGLLNMMPDAALEATERQFLRLIGASNRIAQFYVHLFTIDGLKRGAAAQTHISKYYDPVDRIVDAGLDALIITGANITGPDLTRESFFQPMCDIADWAQQNVTSVLCSCLASHAVWKHHFGLDRNRLPEKLWGVFEHQTVARDHPIVSGVNTRFSAPHSRYNDVSRRQLESAGIKVLTESRQAGVLLATSRDGLRFVFVQGHPEYDTASLAKEYKREVLRFLNCERNDYPPLPDNYFSTEARKLLEAFQQRATADTDPALFPETQLQPLLDNTWTDTGKAILNNWLGLVYQTTGIERGCAFMPGIDPADPLNLCSRSHQHYEEKNET